MKNVIYSLAVDHIYNPKLKLLIEKNTINK